MRALLAVAITLFTTVLAAAETALQPLVGRERAHQVVQGEDLFSIASSYGLALEHLAFANGLEVAFAVPSGRQLVVPGRRVLPVSPPENGLVVNLPERGVFLFRDGAFEKFYPLAIGEPGRFATPQGGFQIVSRVENPNWLPPEWAGLGEDTIVPAGPDNPLGDRWIGLSTPGLGIHSTTSPTSIGAAVSHGCMRMYPTMARELFDKVTVGMPVRIEYQPVKLGYDEENGGVCLVVFPDVYGQGDLLQTARDLLRARGLLRLVDEEWLEKTVARASGTPVPVLEGPVQLALDGRPLPTTPRAALGGGRLWLPAAVARELGMELRFLQEEKAVVVDYFGRQSTFRVDQQSPDEENVALLLNGQALLPARRLLSNFGVPFRWEAPTRTLHIRG